MCRKYKKAKYVGDIFIDRNEDKCREKVPEGTPLLTGFTWKEEKVIGGWKEECSLVTHIFLYCLKFLALRM